MKNKLKIGLSILIALAFILPSGAIIADTSGFESEAGVTEEIRTFKDKQAIGSLEQAAGIVESRGVKMINPDCEEFTIPATLPVEDYYDFKAGLFAGMLSLDETTEVQSGLSLYSIDEGVEVLMYETSFEDNFDIMNNWIQVDKDCGLTPEGDVGFYDTWSWSDARASDGDHSMKNTMYDIYKGNQEDILQCTKVFDMCDQYYYNVSFDVWVEGQWFSNFMTPPPAAYYDYVTFEYSLDGGLNWAVVGEPMPDTTIPLVYRGWNLTSYVTEIGDGWWNVEHQFTVIPGTCDEVMFRFHWNADPELQYEGAYIDNFEVISIEGVEEKIWQTFTQDCTEVPTDENVFIDYPLSWTDVVEGDYYVKYWVEVEDCDPAYDSEFPKPGIIIPFCIKDIADCNISSLTVENSFTRLIVDNDGNMEEGSDAHIMYTFCNSGNLPISNVPIGLLIQKKLWENLFSWDCENNMPIVSSYGEVGTDDFISKDGSKSLYFGNPDTMTYNQDAFTYAIIGPEVDFAEHEQIILEFDYRALTDGDDDGDPWGAGSGSDGTFFPYGDFVYPFIEDVNNNGVYGYGYFAERGGADDGHWEYVLGGYNPEWQHVSIDMTPVFEMLTANPASSTMCDEYGQLVTEHRLGFLMLTDYDPIHWNEYGELVGYDEAGVWIDNIEINGLTVGETVYEDSMILPGPFEPGDCDDFQFEWEDVPFSYYKITVFDECNDPHPYDENDEKSQQILVTTQLERADDKNMESIDYTCDDGEWVISSSDWDNYLATNHNQHYNNWANQVVYLAPEHETCAPEEYCICVDHLDLHNTYVPTVFAEDFTGAWPAGWTPSGEFFYHPGNEAMGAAAGQADVNSGSIVGTGAWTVTPVFSLAGFDFADLTFVQEVNWVAGSFVIHVDEYDGAIWTNDAYTQTITADMPGTGMPITVPLSVTTTQLRFRINGVAPGELGHWVIDDINIDGLTLATENLDVVMTSWWDIETGWDFVYLQLANCPADPSEWNPTYLDWGTVYAWTGFSGGFVTETIDLRPYITGDCFALRFLADSDMGTTARGMKITDLAIMTGSDYIFGIDTDGDGDGTCENNGYDSPDPMDNLDNWCLDCLSYGDFWSAGPPWCVDPIPTLPIEDGLVWATEIADAYEAYLTIELDYDFTSGSLNFGPFQAYVEYFAILEISIDGGSSWTQLDKFTGAYTGSIVYDLTEYTGNDILVRIVVHHNVDIVPWWVNENIYGYTSDAILLWYGWLFGDGGYICIDDMFITGKKDTQAPTSTITMSGTMTDAGWYSTGVSVTITATDDNCVREIHYVLDGSETVVAGDTASFTVSQNGAHDLSFWAVDCVGNVEAEKSIPTFHIDVGSPPTVAITAPEPGLYLFGNQILSSSKVFIIGAFTVEATATDDESGVYRVQFLLDGDVISEDTEVPFSAYVAQKHMGAGTIKVIAEDFSGNTAEDTLDITYYKFL